jgi:ADP-heptose:LPS heptosyltransferase
MVAACNFEPPVNKKISDKINLQRSLQTFLTDPSLSLLPLFRAWRDAKRHGKNLHAILMFSGLGDIVAAEPALRAIKRNDEDMVAIVRPNFINIFDCHEVVKRAFPIHSYAQGRLLKALLPMLRWTNLNVDNHLCDVTKIRFRNHNARGINSANYYSENRTLSDVYSTIAIGERLPYRPRVFSSPPFDSSEYLSKLFPQRENLLLIVHTQSAEPVRSWPKAYTEKAIELVLAQCPVNVLEMGMNPVLQENESIKHMGGHLTIPEQIGIMGHASAFFGVDSGFSHIANALSIPSVYLLAQYHKFDSYLPWRLNDRDILLRSNSGMAWIKPEECAKAIFSILKN